MKRIFGSSAIGLRHRNTFTAVPGTNVAIGLAALIEACKPNSIKILHLSVKISHRAINSALIATTMLSTTPYKSTPTKTARFRTDTQ